MPACCEASPPANYWFVGIYQIPRDWYSDEEHRRYYHEDLHDPARLDELLLVVELGQIEHALGLIDRRREFGIRWLRTRRERLIAAIHRVRRRPAA